MATSNVTVTIAWTKLADDSDEQILIQCAGLVEFEIAAVATETDPTVAGHPLVGRDQAITRDNIGAGYIYARTVSVGSAIFIVTK